jgi:hypothetical protein
MKNALFLVLLSFLFSATLLAQNIPNAGFENWQNVAPYNVEEPVGWVTSNILGASMGLTPNATKVTDSHSGSYAMRLETVSVPGGDALVGSAVCMGGLTGKPVKVTGYYKATFMGNDIGGVGIFIRADNGMAIAGGELDIEANASSYTYFEMPIEYFVPGMEPDSFNLVLFASTDELTPGSVIYFDDLTFDGVSAVGKPSVRESKVSTWPNPASDQLQVSAPVAWGELSLKVIGQNGMPVHLVRFSHQVIVDVSAWTSGKYFLELRDDRGKLLQSDQVMVLH